MRRQIVESGGALISEHHPTVKPTGLAGFRGSTPDVLIQVRELEQLNQRLHEILARHTGQTAKKVAADTKTQIAR